MPVMTSAMVSASAARRVFFQQQDCSAELARFNGCGEAGAATDDDDIINVFGGSVIHAVSSDRDR